MGSMKKKHIKYQVKSGLTILEVLVVTIIIGILTAGSLFILSRMGTHLLVTDTAVTFKQDVALARQLTYEKNRPHIIRCFPDSTPQLWWIVCEDSTGYFTHFRRDTLHRSIRFGVGDDIPLSATGPQGGSIPSDGVSFPGNELTIMPRIGVPNTGTVYFSDGNETRAVLVTRTGTARVMRYANGNWQ